jgi:FKBP-type peptidyl-prolyl cis-trans isomerase
MRRIGAALLLPLLAAAALAGCSSSAAPPASPNTTVTASGSFGTAPTVKIPAQKAASDLFIKTEVHGTGATLAKSDAFLSNYVVYLWSGTTHKLVLSTFTTTPQVLTSQLLPGLTKALEGKKMGSRVLVVVPPKYGYGAAGNSQVGVTGTDTLIFVVDMLKIYPATDAASGAQVSSGGGSLPTVTAAASGKAPTVKVPTTAPPSSLVVKTLIKGSGPPIAKGQYVVTQYVGLNWRTRAIFDSSWARSTPLGFQIDATPAQIIPGWDMGLVGVPVGSRVMLVIPPKDGYGSAGASQAGIKGTDTLVFVVDILDAVSGHSS